MHPCARPYRRTCALALLLALTWALAGVEMSGRFAVKHREAQKRCRRGDSCAWHKCKKPGRCAPVDGVCRSTDAVCRASAFCREKGHCFGDDEYSDSGCLAGSREDCQRSTACRTTGQCEWKGDELGYCTTSWASCRASESCKRTGRCAFDWYDRYRCIADRVNDCRQSLDCREHGRCFWTYRSRRCVTEADTKR
jgi:hypothetical protein